MLTGIGAIAAFAVAQRQGDALSARFAARRDNQADMTRFREAASRHTDVESLLKDRRSLQVVLEAFQLESEISKTGILRKILTEDPTATGSLANRLTDKRWRDLAAAFSSRQASVLTPTQVTQLSTTQVAGFALNQMAGLTSAQLSALSTTQITLLRSDQVAAIATAEIAGMERRDIVALSAGQVAALRPSQLGALTRIQAGAIDPGDLAGLGTAQMRGLGSTQLAGLTTAQLRVLSTTQLSALTTTQLSALTTTQRAALSTTQIASLGGPASRAELPAEASRAPLADGVLLGRLAGQAMVNRYEKSMGEANTGVREALYFVRAASQATSMVQLMSDKALTAVLRGALGLPESFAVLEFDQQRATLEARFDVTKLQNPKEVEKIAQRYLALTAQTETSSNPLVALFDGSTPSLTSLAGGGLSFSA